MSQLITTFRLSRGLLDIIIASPKPPPRFHLTAHPPLPSPPSNAFPMGKAGDISHITGSIFTYPTHS